MTVKEAPIQRELELRVFEFLLEIHYVLGTCYENDMAMISDSRFQVILKPLFSSLISLKEFLPLIESTI